MNIPSCCWKKPIDYRVDVEPKPILPRLKHLVSFAPTIYGLYKFTRAERKKGRKGVTLISGKDDRSIQGVSIGGLGAGTIGRTYRGDFGRWALYPGKQHNTTVFADQFSLRVFNGEETFCSALLPDAPEKGLSSWKWNLPGSYGTYHGLYPRAWTTYDIPGFEKLFITCKQITPIIAQNYKESSYPVGVYEWTFENKGDKSVEADIMLSWQNGDGSKYDAKGGHQNAHKALNISDETGKLSGIEMKYATPSYENGPVTFFIGSVENAEIKITYHTTFNTGKDGKDIWEPFSKKGCLSNDDKQKTSMPGETIGSAVCASIKIAPGKTAIVPFVISWDIPIMTFGGRTKTGGRTWYKRYTRFFGKDGKQALNIAKEAIVNYEDWDRQIEKWQDPVISNEKLPQWFKCALFNEAYYLADGGTAWEAGAVSPDSNHIFQTNKDEIGRFAYLECAEYDMYNTFDVHFYSSFALSTLFPKLQKAIIKDFITTVSSEDKTLWKTVQDKSPVVRKPYGVCPHDLGVPGEDPWFKFNYYFMHDAGIWKDLNAKLVIQVYWEYIKDDNDIEFLKQAWPAVEAALKYLEQFDKDGDGIPENQGVPDQTYDTWTMKGVSAYCCGLWLTANAAAAKMADTLGEKDKAGVYTDHCKKIRAEFESRLWNGEYYRFDTSENSSTIMADQLCGHWWAKVLGLDEAVLPDDHVKKAIKKIFDYNVMKFGDGKLGAVNGMMPDGRMDISCLQSEEVWTGTSYGLASAMLWEGLDETAYKTAYGVYHTTYEHGYMWRTPEAWDKNRRYRAAKYMRPLAVWGMHYAIEHR